MLGILKLCLFFYNKASFEKNLQKKYKELIASHNKGEDIRPLILQKESLKPDMIDSEVVKESLSFELLMQMAIMQHCML